MGPFRRGNTATEKRNPYLNTEYGFLFSVAVFSIQKDYESGVVKLDCPLPLKDHEKVRVTVEGLGTWRHSVLDIRPVSLGQARPPAGPDDDLLADMLVGLP